MCRFMSLMVIVAASLLAAGCTTCDNPYDYCSPVVEGGYSAGLAGDSYDTLRPVPPPVVPEAQPEPVQPTEPSPEPEFDVFELP